RLGADPRDRGTPGTPERAERGEGKSRGGDHRAGERQSTWHMCNDTHKVVLMGRSSSRRVTLAQVAARAGVSTMTASYTFSRPERVSAASREKVLAAAEAMGYAGPDPSARSLRRGQAGALGVVRGEHLTYAFDDPQATAFLAGVAEVCAEQGRAMSILPIVDATADAARISAAAVDGYVVWTTEDGAPVLQ